MSILGSGHICCDRILIPFISPDEVTHERLPSTSLFAVYSSQINPASPNHCYFRLVFAALFRANVFHLRNRNVPLNGLSDGELGFGKARRVLC